MKRLIPLLLLLSSAALADSGAYRIEVIVFRNLDAMAEPANAVELRSFSHFPDLEEKKVETGDPSKRPDLIAKTAETSPGSAGDVYSPPRSDLPDDLHVITEKAFRMDDAWRRLRSSKGYRPLLYASWEQNRTDYYPPMRIHDQTGIDSQLRSPTNIMLADLAAEDPLAADHHHAYADTHHRPVPGGGGTGRWQTATRFRYCRPGIDLHADGRRRAVARQPALAQQGRRLHVQRDDRVHACRAPGWTVDQ